MAGDRIGATMGQLEDLGRTFDRESGTVAQLQSTIGNPVTGSESWWNGGAADRFRQDWQNTYAPMLKKLEESLQAASGEIKDRHRRLQEAGG